MMIHRYKHKETNIVLDVNSGSVHVMDDLAFEICGLMDCDINISDKDMIDNLSKQFSNYEYFDIAAAEAIGEIRSLIQSKRLFSQDIYQNSLTTKNSVVKALCLHIAHGCNLKCKYCFAGDGEYHGASALMSAKTGKQALDFLVLNSGNRRNLEVDFFGGEPTINFDTVRQIVTHGRELEKIHNKKFRFTLTTNAFAIDDDIINFANENMTNVVLSIDGRKEVHDRMRIDRTGNGSYDKILPNIRKFVKSRNGENYFVRGTFTKLNLDFSEDVKLLYSLGFKQVSIEPVVAPPDKEFAISEKDLPELFVEYEKLTEYALENTDLNFFHFNIDLTGGSCALKRISGCGAGCEYMAVTPEGDLFPCHQFVGIEGFRLGSVFGGLENKELADKFNSLNVYTKAECRTCWARFYCSGGCAANAYHFGGDISAEYEIGCELQKKRIECAVYMKVRQAGLIAY